MGSAQSSQLNQTMDVVNSTVTNIVNVTKNTSSAININANSFTIRVGAPQVLLWAPPPGSNAQPVFSTQSSCRGCVLNLGQKITATQKVSVNAAVTNTANLQTQLTTALTQAASQQSSATQGALATSLNVQNSKTSINTAIKNLVETNITNETTNAISGLINNANNGIIELVGNNDGMTITNPQEILTEQIVNMISTALVSNGVSTAVTATASQKAEQVTDVKQQGAIDAVGGVIGKVGDLVSGPFKYIAIAIIAVSLLGVIGKMIMSKKSESAFGRRRRR